MANIYCGSTKYTAVAVFAINTVYTVGQIVRQTTTPAVGSERCFRVSTAGTSAAVEPTWVLTANSTTTSGAVTFTECTGLAIYNGDGGGTAWGAPHARIANALAATWSAAGDNIYVSNNHAETQGSAITWPTTAAGTQASPVKVVCVNDTVVPPTSRATTATVSTTGAFAINISCGALYVYGIKFQAGSAASAATIAVGVSAATPTSVSQIYDNCLFLLNNTATTSRISLGVTNSGNNRAQQLSFKGCKFQFGNASQLCLLGNAIIDIYGGDFCQAGTVPTVLFSGILATASVATFRGVNLSSVATTLFNIAITTSFLIVDMLNCAINSSVTKTTGTQLNSAQCMLRMHASDAFNILSGVFDNTNLGLATSSTSTFCNQANAAPDGTKTALTISTSTSSLIFPKSHVEIYATNSITGTPVTATIEMSGSGSINDKLVWAEFEYLNSATLSTTAIASTKTNDDILSVASTTYPTSSATWTAGGAVNQKMQATFTPQRAGVVKARLYFTGNPTVSVDPRITIA